jgi:mono/diheme cytochrome c family protein
MKLIKITGIVVSAIIVLIAGFLIYISTALPNVDPAPDIKIELTEDRIERGKHLANNVMVCMHCHSPQEKYKFAHPQINDSLGAGGNKFGVGEGLPGEYYAPNITPAKLGDWSDGEIYRAITSGVSKDGTPLFPIMPYPNYAQLEKEDIYSVIAYLRTLKPIEKETPKSESYFPMNFIIRTIPQNPTHDLVRDTTNLENWGKYLVTAGSCTDCHTPKEKGANIPGMEFAGGMEFPMIDGSIARTANITPDPKTGLGDWDEDFFLTRFKTYADSSFIPETVPHGKFNTSMPWMQFSQLSDAEIKAIYAYLRTVNPVENAITVFTPAE